MSRIIAIIRINDTFGRTEFHFQMTSRCTIWVPLFQSIDVGGRVSSPSTTEANRNKIKYESDLWLYNRNLMKMLFRLFSERNSANFIRFRHSASGCCCEVIRSFFFRRFLCDSYRALSHIPITSRTYRSFSFVYLFVMKFILSFMALALYLNAKTALANNNKAGEMSEGKKEKCHTENFLKRKREKRNFRSQNYYAVM